MIIDELNKIVGDIWPHSFQVDAGGKYVNERSKFNISLFDENNVIVHNIEMARIHEYAIQNLKHVLRNLRDENHDILINEIQWDELN